MINWLDLGLHFSRVARLVLVMRRSFDDLQYTRSPYTSIVRKHAKAKFLRLSGFLDCL